MLRTSSYRTSNMPRVNCTGQVCLMVKYSASCYFSHHSHPAVRPVSHYFDRLVSSSVYSPTRVFRSIPLLLFADFLILVWKCLIIWRWEVFFNFILNYANSQLKFKIQVARFWRITSSFSRLVEIPCSEEENLKTFLEQCGGKTCEGMSS